MDWLLVQAQTAGPFVAVFCMVVLSLVAGVLWRQHLRDQATILSMTESITRAMVASARAQERLAASIRRGRK